MSESSGKRAFVRSKWMVVGSFAEHVIQFAVFAVLVAVLSVEDFGLVAFLNVILEFVSIFFVTGMVQALIQMKDWDDRVASICFTANLVMALAFCLLLTFGIGTLLDAHYRSGSSIILGALSVSLIIDAARAVHVAKLRRDLAFGNLAWRGTISNLLGGAAAIGFAYAGFGIWTLVLHRLTVSFVNTSSVWSVCKWRPRIILSGAVLRQLAPFSIRSTSSELLYILGARATDLLVGILLGPVSMALYRVASRCVEALQNILIQPLHSASFPILSRIKGKENLGRAVERLTIATSAVAFPALVGTAVLAPEIILVFGNRYTQSAPILAILALGALPTALILFVQPALLATGQTGQMVRLQGVAAIAKLAFGFSLGWFGAIAAATGGAASQLLLVPYFLLIGTRKLAVDWKMVLVGTAPPLLASVLMGLSLHAIRQTYLTELSAVERISVIVPCGLLLFGFFLLLFGKRYLKRLFAEAEPLLRKKKRMAAPAA